MKYIKIYQLIIIMGFILSAISCDKEEPVPNITVGFSFDPASPVAGDQITFTNASTGGTTFSWEFGDGNVSTDKNPTHTFQADGTYEVSLMVDNHPQLVYSENIVVGKPSPVMTFAPNPIETGVPTTFTASVYNPTGATVTYNWDFPETGWMSDDLDATGAGTGESVVVTFTDANTALPVSVTANIGSDALSTSQNITVNAQLAKTLWIAEKGGNLISKQIFLKGEAQLDDSGIPSGAHPLTMDFSSDRLYVFDAGSTLTFSAELETSPGQIFSMMYDGTDYLTHITFSNQNYDDSFFGSVDGTDMIFADRRNDITVVPTSTTNFTWGDNGADGNPAEFPHLVKNAELAYYSANAPAGYTGPTYGWGALNGTVERVEGVYWWAKNSNHKGLYRFSDDDIGVTDAIPTEGAILGSYGVRAFAIDHDNGKVYFSANNPVDVRGFYVADTDGSNITLIDDSPYDGEGGENEPTFITDIEVDNESGYVYWAYRGPAAADLTVNPLHASGIKRYKLDGTGSVEYFVEGVEAYGLAIDDAKR